jgi:hypothetical protein
MAVLIFVVVLIGIPAALVVWRRRGQSGLDGTDPHANRDVGRLGGPPAHPDQGGTGGSAGSL